MLETVLNAVLAGSPWAIIVVLGVAVYKKDQRIVVLTTRIDELHGEFGGQLDALHEKRLADSKEREGKYQETATGLKDNLGAVDTRLQVIEAKLPGSGGD